MESTVNRLHVLVLPAWMPDEQAPATGAFILDQAEALAQFAETGILYAGTRQVLASALQGLEAQGIHVYTKTIPYIPKAAGFCIAAWCRQYYQAFEAYCLKFGKPDILHAHSYIAGIAAEYIAARATVPFVLTEHATAFLAGTIRPVHRRFIARMLQRAAEVIAVGAALATALKAYTDRQISVIPNGIDPSVFYWIDDKGHPPTIIVVGALIRRKRVDLVIKALQALPEIDLVIIGSGVERQRLGLLAKQCAVNDRIRWVPFAAKAEIAAHMQRADLLVSASDTETFGVVVLEALACGLPVVATASGGPEQFVPEAYGKILNRAVTADALADAIRSVLRNQNSYDGKAISEWAHANFNRMIIAQRLIEQYRQILNQA